MARVSNPYADGYGQGMTDLANKILDEGWDAAVLWVIDNCPDRELADRLRTTLERH